MPSKMNADLAELRNRSIGVSPALLARREELMQAGMPLHNVLRVSQTPEERDQIAAPLLRKLGTVHFD